MEDGSSGSKVWVATFERYKETWKWYEKWVCENPDVVTQIEKTFRVFSYILPGAINVDTVYSELVFSLSNLLVFVHDGILRRIRGASTPHLTVSATRLMQWLTVIDHTEVFIELAAGRSWGEAGRWLIIAVIQILRATLRLVLLLRHKAGVQSQPPIQCLNRDTDLKTLTVDENSKAEVTAGSVDGRRSGVFRGERSGRVVRTLDAAPDIHQRTWSLPTQPEGEPPQEKKQPTELLGFPLAGECLQIARPLGHLTAILLFGQQSWKPWILALGADIVSLRLLTAAENFNKAERKELANRSLNLLIYLLRTPCYDHHTRSRLLHAMIWVSEKVPLTRLIMKPLMEYVPLWQSIYFYNWGR